MATKRQIDKKAENLLSINAESVKAQCQIAYADAMSVVLLALEGRAVSPVQLQAAQTVLRYAAPREN